MTGDDLSHQKRALRAELRERRRIMTSTERETATGKLTQHLIDLAVDLAVTSLSAYLPTTDEPDIRPFLAWARHNGIRILYPISREDGLLDWIAGDGEAEVEGRHGMPEPEGELLGPIAINDVDLIIVPAAAVDHSGLRLGWGRGYFDKMLGSMQKRPPVYAVIFDNEYVEVVPREVHDQPVDGIVTPGGITFFDE